MAEGIVTQEQQTQTANPLPQELQDQMNFSLGIEKPKAEEVQITAEQQAAAALQQQQQSAEPFSILKEKYGYNTAEDALAEIEQLRAFKEKPPTAEIKFENPDSERIFKAVQSGKTTELYGYLAQQEKLNSITSNEINKDNAADVIKLGMQLKYKDLTPDEINYKFNKQFSIPKEPVQLADEEDADFANRKVEWQAQVQDVEMNKIIEAKLLKPELEAAKTALVFPEIPQATDEGYDQWLKSLEDSKRIDAETKEAYKAFLPDAVKTSVNFNDEANKIALDYEFVPDKELFDTALQMVSDQDNFWGRFKNQDGSPNRQAFLKFVINGLSAEKQVTEGIKQGKNAAIKAKLPDNSQGGMGRQNVTTAEPSELDKQMQASLAPFQRR